MYGVRGGRFNGGVSGWWPLNGGRDEFPWFPWFPWSLVPRRVRLVATQWRSVSGLRPLNGGSDEFLRSLGSLLPSMPTIIISMIMDDNDGISQLAHRDSAR